MLLKRFSVILLAGCAVSTSWANVPTKKIAVDHGESHPYRGEQLFPRTWMDVSLGIGGGKSVGVGPALGIGLNYQSSTHRLWTLQGNAIGDVIVGPLTCITTVGFACDDVNEGSAADISLLYGYIQRYSYFHWAASIGPAFTHTKEVFKADNSRRENSLGVVGKLQTVITPTPGFGIGVSLTGNVNTQGNPFYQTHISLNLSF